MQFLFLGHQIKLPPTHYLYSYLPTPGARSNFSKIVIHNSLFVLIYLILFLLCLIDLILLYSILGFPCGSAGKESTCNAGNLVSIPGLGRSPGEGKGYPLQYSGLENSMDCLVHGVGHNWATFTFTFILVSQSLGVLSFNDLVFHHIPATTFHGQKICLVITHAAAAAAAKSLQSCPTLCDPIDGSLPGSPIPGILQARTVEWVAISFSNAWKWKVKVKSLSCVWLLATPWTAAYWAPPLMGFSRQEYWSGVPLPSLVITHASPK